jgi:hypothetical protein
MTKSSYSVGKGKPPAHAQFKKGQSGNPGGKPKSRKAPPTTSMQQRLKEALEEAIRSDWEKLQDWETDDDVKEPMQCLANDLLLDGFKTREGRKTLLALMEKLDQLKTDEKMHKPQPVSLSEGKAEGKAEGKTAEAVAPAEKTDANQ